MQSMCKTYFPLTRYMKNDPVFGEFWSTLKREYDLIVAHYEDMGYDLESAEEIASFEVLETKEE